jgi:hypothetical protein
MTHIVRAVDQTSNFFGLHFHGARAPDGTGEFFDPHRTLELFVLKPFLEPMLDEE